MPSEDGRGLVQVSADMIPSYVQHWEILPKVGRQLPQPQAASQSGAKSNAVVSTRDQTRQTALEPILTSKTTYMTEHGYPRTEYYWRHPPVFEDAFGRTQPVYMAGFLNGQMNSPFSVLERDASGSEKTRPQNGGREEESLLRDSGYGAGNIRGLTDKSPTSGPIYDHTNTGRVKKASSGDKDVGSSEVEEAKLARIEHELDEAEAASRRADSTDEERRRLVTTKLHAIEQEMNQVRL